MATRMKHGKPVSDEELDRMAAEAEAGYDLATWTRRRGRPSLDGRDAGGPSPRLATRVPAQLRDRVAARASGEGRSISQVMRRLLEQYADGQTQPQGRRRPSRR